MRRLVVLSLPLLVCFVACIGRDRRNANCQWPEETAISLDLRNPEQQRHLSDEAELAEDLAIRYADSGKGLRSRHVAGPTVYERTRDECMRVVMSHEHRIAAGGIVISCRKILLVMCGDENGSYLVASGGAIEDGESLAAAAQREVEEDPSIKCMARATLIIENICATRYQMVRDL